MAECDKCVNENRISALEKDSERNSQQHREFYNKFGETEVKQAVADEKYSQILTTQKSMDDKLTKMLEEPRSNYNTIKMCIATAVASGVVGYLVSFLFK